MAAARRHRARRGTGSITACGGRLQAQVSLGSLPDARRLRRSRTFDSREQAQAWIAAQKVEHGQLTVRELDEFGAAGVDHGSLKTFRSTVATQLAEAGLHPRKTQTFLGHAHVTTTMTCYTAVTGVDEAADLLPDLDR